jgi:hypothetical protein
MLHYVWHLKRFFARLKMAKLCSSAVTSNFLQLSARQIDRIFLNTKEEAKTLEEILAGKAIDSWR